MGRREDDLLNAMDALCSEEPPGARRMLVIPALCSATVAGLGKEYDVARAGDVLVLWRTVEAVPKDGEDEPDCGDQARAH